MLIVLNRLKGIDITQKKMHTTIIIMINVVGTRCLFVVVRHVNRLTSGLISIYRCIQRDAEPFYCLYYVAEPGALVASVEEILHKFRLFFFSVHRCCYTYLTSTEHFKRFTQTYANNVPRHFQQDKLSTHMNWEMWRNSTWNTVGTKPISMPWNFPKLPHWRCKLKSDLFTNSVDLCKAIYCDWSQCVHGRLLLPMQSILFSLNNNNCVFLMCVCVCV